jgi:hypothetical protein
MPKRIDITGKKYGKLLIIRMLNDKKKYGRCLYECQCDCGNFINSLPNSLKRGLITSCGMCIVNKNMNKKFGKLKILSFSEFKNRLSYVNCLCDCGNIKVLPTTLVVRGKIQSCGCLRDDINREKANLKIGKKFYNLKVYKINKDNNNVFCKCICGNKIEIRQGLWGYIKSCGCSRLISIPKGGDHPFAVLTNSQAEAIRELNKSNIGYNQKQLADMFNVHPSTISRILKNKRYKQKE